MDYSEEAKNNALILKWAIDDLSSVNDDTYEMFCLFREKSVNIHELFKSLKPIPTEDRENLWAQFKEILYDHCLKRASKKKRILFESQKKKEIILSIIQEAEDLANQDYECVKKSYNLLKLASEKLKSEGPEDQESKTQPDDFKLTKNDLEICQQRLLEIKDKGFWRRRKILFENYSELKKDLDVITEQAYIGRPLSALRLIKAARKKVSKLPMSVENTSYIVTHLQECWMKASERNLEGKAATETLQKEKELKKAEQERLKAEREEKKKERQRLKAEQDEIKRKEKERIKAERISRTRERNNRIKEVARKNRERKMIEHWKWGKEETERKQWDSERMQIIKTFDREIKRLEIEKEKKQKKQREKEMAQRKQFKHVKSTTGKRFKKL